MDLKELLEGKKHPTDLIIVILWSIIAAVVALALPDGNILRMILGIPLVIFLSGYALVSVLWPGIKTEVTKSIDDLERIALSFGLSMVLISITGLVLSYSPLGVTFESSLYSNLIITLILVSIAFFLRNRLPEDQRFYLNILFFNRILPEGKNEKIFVAVIVICLIIAGISFAILIMTPGVDDKYSEFYILDANGTAENYPTNLTTNDAGQVIVGLKCHEYETTNYEIIIGIEEANTIIENNDWSLPFDLISMNRSTRTVILEHDGVFEEVFNFNINEPGIYKITWQLNIEGENSDYDVYFWVEVLE